MYDLSIYNFLKDKLNPCKLTLKKDETRIRCPFCKDSIHDKLDSHFYINNKPPFKFYCQKCNVSGYFNGKLLNEVLKLYDGQLIDHIDTEFIKYKKQLVVKYGESYENYFKHSKELIFEPKNYGFLEMKKLNYIQNRLGINLILPYDLTKYSIILNIYDFFDRNDINYKKFPNYLQNKIKELSNTHVMFLLYDKNMICCRNITNEGERYYNLMLFESNDDGISKKFYSIKNDINYHNRVFNVNATEGIFDIIGVHNHIFDRNLNDNDLFLAANGKGYKFLLNYITKLGILNCNINIYSDKDVDKNYYLKFKDNLMITKYNGINLYYNKNPNEKDFGIKKENILLDNPIIL